MSVHKLKFKEQAEELVCLDLGTGAGKNKPDGFLGVDIVKGKAVDKVCDLTKPWPWKSNSIDELAANYLLQYLSAKERIHFANEAHRVLKTGGKCVIAVPHWCASQAYGDLLAQFPPVSESWFPFLNKAFRDANDYDGGYKCDFDITLGYGMHPHITTRAVEYQQNAITWYKEAAQAIHATITKR